MDPTDKEIQLIDTLKKKLSDLNIPKHFLEDKNLLRYLRARRHCLQNAETMFRRQIDWREENDMKHSLEWSFPKEFKSYWPWSLTGFDDLDGPVMVVPFGIWDPAKVSGNYTDFVKYCYQSLESVWTLMQEKSVGRKTFVQFCIIFDLKGLGFKHVSNFDAMSGILESVKAFEANYPETLRVGLLINAPYVFEIAWRLIKPFVSEETHSKLQFCGSDVKSWRQELLKYMTEDQFPVRYGGTRPDASEISVESTYAKLQNSNSNDYICENLMATKIGS